MKPVLFLQDFGPHKAGEQLLADDQIACNAIAAGAAVPSVQAMTGSAVASEPKTSAKPSKAKAE